TQELGSKSEPHSEFNMHRAASSLWRRIQFLLEIMLPLSLLPVLLIERALTMIVNAKIGSRRAGSQ
ncbi:hypothetical protein HispidOSU_002508, partial [Sigmodon hispidus]